MKRLICILFLLMFVVMVYSEGIPIYISKTINLISEKLEIIDSESFEPYEDIDEILLPKTLKTIEAESFSSIINVDRISFNDYTEYVSEYAFVNCNIKRVDVVSQTIREVIFTRNGNYSTLNFYYSDLLYKWGLIEFSQIFINETRRNPYVILKDGSVEPLYGCKYFTPKYKSYDGILFTYNGSKLIYYPNGRENETYTVPNTVKELGIAAFRNNKHLKTVRVPKGLNYIKTLVFLGTDCEIKEY